MKEHILHIPNCQNREEVDTQELRLKKAHSEKLRLPVECLLYCQVLFLHIQYTVEAERWMKLKNLVFSFYFSTVLRGSNFKCSH